MLPYILLATAILALAVGVFGQIRNEWTYKQVTRRNMWVYNVHIATLQESLDKYHKLASYDEMLGPEYDKVFWTFWCWDANKFWSWNVNDFIKE